jgi:hypothetical protein
MPRTLEDTLKPAREAVRAELNEVLRQIEALHQRATILQQTLNGMNAVIEPDNSGRDRISDVLTASANLGMSEAVRRVFRASGGSALTAPQVRDELLRMKFDISKYAQPMVPLHNTLKRLEAQGEIKSTKDSAMRPAYVWVTEAK